MKPSDLILKQIEDSQRLSKQLEVSRQSDLQRIAGAFATNGYFSDIERLAAQVNLAKGYLDTSGIAESARIASGQLAAFKASMAVIGTDYSEVIRKISGVPASIKLLQERAYNFEQQFRLSNQQDFARLSELAKITIPQWTTDIAMAGANLQR